MKNLMSDEVLWDRPIKCVNWYDLVGSRIKDIKVQINNGECWVSAKVFCREGACGDFVLYSFKTEGNKHGNQENIHRKVKLKRD